jgi:hypothetical protein
MEGNLNIQEKEAGGALTLLLTVWRKARTYSYKQFNHDFLVVKPVVSQYPPSYVN